MAFATVNANRTFAFGKSTQTAGTVIIQVVPPLDRCRTKLRLLYYTCAGTAHTITLMRPLAKTTVSADAAAGATTLYLTRDPGAYAANNILDGFAVQSVADNAVAANDYLLVKQPDGVWLLLKPSAVSVNSTTGVVALTVTALGTGGIKAGAPVFFFGITTDLNPRDGLAHHALSVTASALNTWDRLPVIETFGTGEPLLIYSNNATAAGTIEGGSVTYGM